MGDICHKQPKKKKKIDYEKEWYWWWMGNDENTWADITELTTKRSELPSVSLLPCQVMGVAPAHETSPVAQFQLTAGDYIAQVLRAWKCYGLRKPSLVSPAPSSHGLINKSSRRRLLMSWWFHRYEMWARFWSMLGIVLGDVNFMITHHQWFPR